MTDSNKIRAWKEIEGLLRAHNLGLKVSPQDMVITGDTLEPFKCETLDEALAFLRGYSRGLIAQQGDNR